MSLVRYANATDAPAIVELARREHAMSTWASEPFEDASANDTALAFIRGHGKTALVSDGGYLLGLVQPTGFSRRLMALEYAWFAHDGSGLVLLQHFSAWAKNMGATYITVHNYTNDRRLARVLTGRFGFSGIGQAMVSKLEA